MTADRKNIISAVIASVLALSLFKGVHDRQIKHSTGKSHITVGFIYDGDDSTPYTANYIQAVQQLDEVYGSRVTVIERKNVPYESSGDVINELAENGCELIFTNSYGYGETAKKMAEEYPDIEFCAATCDNSDDEPQLDNYHTCMGEIYQGRYLSGMVAGLKMKEMISDGTISPDQAQVGYVAAYPNAEVISGYTAFILGVRSQCPEAVMRVRYINSWTNFSLEHKTAEKLINEGCVMISHHSNTIGSAIACEEANKPYPIYHIGYNQNMMNVAPTAELTGTRIDWTPYITGAVGAVLKDEDIEEAVDGHIFGQDASGGLKEGWVKLIGINTAAAAEGTEKLIKKATEDFSDGRIRVFFGDYTGKDPDDPTDTADLRQEYKENEYSSAPTFHYVLDDIIIIEE